MRYQTNGGQDNHAAHPVDATEPTDLGGDISCGINQLCPATSDASDDKRLRYTSLLLTATLAVIQPAQLCTPARKDESARRCVLSA